jgi:hypothetical protein
MKSSFRTALVAAIVSAFVASGAAVATTQGFVLGATNRVNAPSQVTNVQANATVNPVDAPLLTLENKSTTANATPLSLVAAPNHAPFRVNTSTKVANLNADQLDGHDSTYFLPKTGKAADSGKLDGYPSGAFSHLQRSTSLNTSDCGTAAQTWTECGVVSVTVPPGQLWHITVISTVTAEPNTTQTAGLCPATDGPQCLRDPELTTFWGNAYSNWASSASGYFAEGTYRFNTAEKWALALPAAANAPTTTTVIAYDARQEELTGP